MKHGLPSVWDEKPELVDQLKVLFSDGLSYAKIAEELGYGLSRSAVLGKARRLGMRIPGHPRQPTIVKPSGGARTPRAPKSERAIRLVRDSVPLPLFTHAYVEPLGEPNSIVNAGQCKYIHGEVGVGSEWRMCGHETGAPEKSFCQFHAQRCYVARAKKEAA